MSQASDIFNAKDLVVVITGGGTGIGLQGALALDANGAKAVYIIGRREAKLKEAVAKAKNGSLIPLVGDATSKQDLERMAAQVKSDQGYINVLWANAGVTGPMVLNKLPKDRTPTIEEFKTAAWETPIEEFNQTFAVNTAAPFYGTLAFLELLDAGNGKVYQKSQVVVTASIGGLNRLPQNGWAYQPSKAGAIHLVKMMSSYFAPWKIRANCLAPGLYPSEMTDGAFSFVKDTQVPITQEGAVPSKLIPLERAGTPDDAAGVILFLMSKAGSYMNGVTIVSDGGRLGQVPAVY